MENHSKFDRHPPEDVFEEYVFDRLDEDQSAAFEEHLLTCERCRHNLEKTDEYVRLMKEAAAQFAGSGAHNWHSGAALQWGSPIAAIMGAGLVTAALAIAIPYHFRAERPPVPVQLVSFRGGTGQLAHARAGAGIDITIDCTDVGETAGLRLEIVDAVGNPVWNGSAAARAGSNLVSAHATEALRAGVYWIRLYAPSGELLREFGLKAE